MMQVSLQCAQDEKKSLFLLFYAEWENKRSFRSFDAWRRQMKVQVSTATSGLTYRALSVQFNASPEALWWVENVNFMPYRLWLKSLMDTCLEHDRLISVFSSSFLSISAWAFLAFNRNGREEMEKTCTIWDIRPLIRGTLLSHCVYLSWSTKCVLHSDIL